MALFRSKASQDIEAVEQRLADAIAAQTAIEAELRERSVQLVIADDAAGLAKLRQRLADATAHRDLCELAAGQARAAETKRQAEARIAAEKSRRREMIRLAGVLAADYRDIADHMAGIFRSVERITANASPKFEALAGPDVHDAAAQFTLPRLGMMVEAEERRLFMATFGSIPGDMNWQRKFPFLSVGRRSIHGEVNGQPRPMHELLDEAVAGLRTALDGKPTPKAPPVAQEARPVAEPDPVAEPLPDPEPASTAPVEAFAQPQETPISGTEGKRPYDLAGREIIGDSLGLFKPHEVEWR